MTPETQFFAGDVTMEFTAAAVLLLVQDGKVSLDDRSKYVPELQPPSDGGAAADADVGLSAIPRRAT